MTIADPIPHISSPAAPSTPSITPAPLTIGIDVGKSFIDVHVAQTNQNMRLPNTAQGHETLIRRIGQTPVKACVFEATGMYSRALHAALHAAGYPTMRVNPRQSCLFLKSHSPSHKTDRADAIGIVFVLSHFVTINRSPLNRKMLGRHGRSH